MHLLLSIPRWLAWRLLGIRDPLADIAEQHDLPWLRRGARCRALQNPGKIEGARGSLVVVRLADGRRLEVAPDRLSKA